MQGDGLQLHLRILPSKESVLQPCTIVVVCRSAPEIGGYLVALFQHRSSVEVEVFYQARASAYGYAHACSREGVARQLRFHPDGVGLG